MNLVVKTHRPWKSRSVIALILLGLAVTGWTLFDYGRFIAGYNSKTSATEISNLNDVVQQKDKRIEELREEKAVLERAAQIERKAYNELDTALKVLQGEILELKEELEFYRGIVSPQQSRQGLHLQSFTLDRNGPTRSFHYKVVLTQVLKNERISSGRLRFLFEGLENGEQKKLELRHVTEKSIKELNYSFKYFQNIEGDVEIPENFSPLRVTVQVLPRGNERDMIEKTIQWPFEENEAHVGTKEET